MFIRKGVFIATLTLAGIGFVACTKSSPDVPAPNVASISSNQTSIELLRTGALSSDPLERVVAATALPEGGILTVANRRGGSSFVYKLSSSGALVWRKEVSALLATAVRVVQGPNQGNRLLTLKYSN